MPHSLESAMHCSPQDIELRRYATAHRQEISSKRALQYNITFAKAICFIFQSNSVQFLYKADDRESVTFSNPVIHTETTTMHR